MQFEPIWYENALVNLERLTGLQDIAFGHLGSTQGSDIQLHMQL
jgi:hypothetical protein